MWRDLGLDDRHRPLDRQVEITDVRTMGLRGNPKGDDDRYTWGIVAVDTDAGEHGIGETFRGEEPLDVADRMAPHVIGETPLDPDRIRERLAGAYTSSGGIGQSAITAIETACWDVKGKLHGLPVYELMGGAYRDAVRAYSDTQATARDVGEAYTPEAYARAARDVVDQGFEIIKFDLDVPMPGREPVDTANRRLDNAAIQHKADLVEAVREEVGYEVDLGMDLHWKFTVETAVRLGKALEPYDLAFLEDPVHPRKIDAQARVADRVDIPILTGENVTTAPDFHELLANDLLDVAAPDVSMCGGLSELRRIAALCDVHGVPLAPHNLGSPVATVAGVHACASVPNGYSLEFRGGDAPHWEDVVRRTGGDGPILDDGRIALPQGPGLGVELAGEAREHLTDESEWVL